jgi:putative membrane-bound dehydrogenase-like protein
MNKSTILLRHLLCICACCAAVGACCSAVAQQSAGWQFDRNVNRDALPTVPDGFEVSFFAREPLVRQPCSMAFDAKGRLCVGMGPQYRNPKPDTPGDSVALVLDDNGDGKADRIKTFATGFNAIQGLAWHGRDLWVANTPDLTVVRDLDGDDEADEYVRVYTDLGNLEHGLHGLNWAPDGKLYMSKGNSKGLTQPGRIAPKPFRELWGVNAPDGSPDFPEPRTFTKGEYRKSYHDPEDDWGREGGVLRCDDGGRNLEIVSRGMRNPWDIAFDTGFNWLGTDNDQTTGDRVFMPFFGAHFGWNHPWSAHWGTDAHPPSAPVSGPLFEGSGTGVIFGDSPPFPSSHRGVFFINDWLRKTTFVWRPRWDGALLRPAGGDWEPFVQGGPALFRPTDLEIGPDGALWILGWGSGYGAEYQDGQMTSEGRVFRVVAKNSPAPRWETPKRSKPLAQWTVAELVEDFDGPLPVWRMNAQDELLRRGAGIKPELLATLEARGTNESRETWAAWTLGRLMPQDRTMDEWFAERAVDSKATLNLRVQSLRILAHRFREAGAGRELPASVASVLGSAEPRLRFESVHALGQARPRSAVPALLDLLAAENDSTTFYAAWQTLRGLQDSSALKPLLADSRSGVRKAALLALLEDHSLQEAEVRPLVNDTDAGVRDVAALWLRKASGGGEAVVVRGRPLNAAPVETVGPSVGLARNIKARSGARYTLAVAGLRPGARPYSDRSYGLKQVPAALAGLDFIQTANNDDGSRGEGWLSFEALMPMRIHVAFDTRATAWPAWLREQFQRTDQRIRADHWTFQLHTREFPAGRIELGGNTDDGKAGGKGNYIVVLEPLPLAPPTQATAVDPTLALLNQSDRERGEWLFHARGGAGCFNCHRLGEHGNSFGPDLAALGERATARHIIQSMLEPNAVITEGFNLQTVETADAEYSGILLEESGLSLTLGLATGQRQIIAKSKITSRKTATASAMPVYDTSLTPHYVADLTAYLLAQKAGAPSIARPAAPPAPIAPRDPRRSEATAPATPLTQWPAGDGFRFAERQDRLVIAHTGQPVAEFVFRDETILRPYFANVHAPGGLKVTRNHPPVTGVDATDHETMHPGLWLAFGDISGADFWRNKGHIEHVRFTKPPAVREGRLTFATECRLRTADGRYLCSLTNHFALSAQTNAWLLVWDATFRSDEGSFTFGDQEEMGFGARVATAITEKNGGVITSSTGLKTAKNTWGQPAEWCDYSGMVDGKPVGITLLSDPGNFRPSWWHNRDYGVFVANPFGRAAMRQGDKSAVTVKRGEDFHLRFVAVIH